ncbi:nitroreductase [Pseudooceanicola sediminis]|uniref:Putative NAD(P)H nitroreductase n=1 Tax=Pseudooceanicola sediminis TaxID=2211117 RepID=A0A399IWR0_9RHOB|nr:nitroreductase family protein [Pseudooceanicola sediminis]KAA2312372.1 nitroreductase [Puniceibacterium sp. HSS470]RII37420.1 nitroreductase [Pseudooceanicola sediminis]|tara:strand:- start:496 stop:1074 length:579 start_codon:yes stop_codon:yes gene_type:complete
MPDANPAALSFLLTRRSRPAKTLVAPGPTAEALAPILTAAARTPDHGKLEPWRFIVIEGAAFARLATLAGTLSAQAGRDEAQIAKDRSQFDQGILAVAVVESPKPSDKVPALEQTYSAGAVCLALLNAALAAGWGANWLSGWASHDAAFVQQGLGLAPHERLAGIVHIATEKTAPPERPRPDTEALTTWLSA